VHARKLVSTLWLGMSPSTSAVPDPKRDPAARQVAPVVPTVSVAPSVSVRDAPDRQRVAQEKALAAPSIVPADPTVSVDLAANAPPAPSLKLYLVLMEPPLPLVWLSLQLVG
jgi:hypothetical protein